MLILGDVARYMAISRVWVICHLSSSFPVDDNLPQLNILVSKDGVAKLSDFDHSILSSCSLVFSATSNVGGGTLRWMVSIGL